MNGILPEAIARYSFRIMQGIPSFSVKFLINPASALSPRLNVYSFFMIYLVSMLADDLSFRFVPPAYSSPNELKKAGVIQGLHAERMASATVLFTANWVLANHKIELQIEQRKVILLNTTVGGTRVRIGLVDVPLCYRHPSTPPHATSAIIHVDRGISAHRCFFTNAAGFMTGIP